MSPATITPTTLTSASYTIQNSDRAIAELQLAVTIATSRIFTVRYPSAAPGVAIVLRRTADGVVEELALNPAPSPDEATFPGRRIAASITAVSPSVSELACEVSLGTGGSAGSDRWTIRISGLGGQQCVVGQDENLAQQTIRRLICDPVAEFTIGGGAIAAEGAAVALTAQNAIGTGTVVRQSGELDPHPTYRWSHDGAIAIMDLPKCGPQTFSPTMPGVYADTTLNLHLDVDFEGLCPTTPATLGFLRGAVTHPLTVRPRPHRMVLVLDRSGSMSGQRWDNAVTAARVLVHLVAALRVGVSGGDRIGILCFEDSTCSWHTGPSPGTQVVLPMGELAAADAQICSLELSAPGSCTSIGDALVQAMDLLTPTGVADDPRFTIALFTDGYENAGRVVVDPPPHGLPAGTALVPPYGLPPGITPFSKERVDRPTVNSRLALHTIGFGSFTQEDVLARLGADSSYRHVTDVNQITGAIAEMLSFSLEVREVYADATSTTTEKLFLVDTGVRRIAVAVEWLDEADTIHLARRESNGSYTDQGSLKRCPTHGFVGIEIPAGSAATTWRVTRENSAGLRQPIADADIMFFADLVANGDVVFDKQTYRTGEGMAITARLRVGSQPITGATVTVEATAPGESLGTFLATNAQGYAPGTHTSTPSVAAAASRAPDPLAPKPAMLSTLLTAKGWEELPYWTPPGVFVDGTNLLHEDPSHPDGPGNYRNVYPHTGKEGSHTFRFTVEGKLPNGDPYRQTLTLSKWVGVNVDPFESTLHLDFLPSQGDLRFARVVVTPQDGLGNLLGPFRGAELHLAASAGAFVALDPGRKPVALVGDDGLADNLDGSYSQVLEYRKHEVPVVSVEVHGKQFLPAVVSTGCLGALFGPLTRLVAWVVRRAKRRAH